MKKFAVTLATTGTLAVMAVGMAGPALAAPGNTSPNYDAVYVTGSDTASYQAVDCSVHVNSGGTDVNVNWC
ncbi:MAG TPA: hypothetical protein VE666_12475 [Mycobacterium sp.]|jgi:hypothetical protein|nr:hypothetical protein [Mycobacterium sp.]